MLMTLDLVMVKETEITGQMAPMVHGEFGPCSIHHCDFQYLIIATENYTSSYPKY